MPSQPVPVRSGAGRGGAQPGDPGPVSVLLLRGGGGGDFAGVGVTCPGFPTCSRPIRAPVAAPVQAHTDDLRMAPLLRLCLCLALLLLPPAAPAPTPAPAPGRSPDWAACRILSRELSRLLVTVKEPHSALEGMQLVEEDPENWPPRIRCSDSCDPLTLESNNSTRCLQRIRQALQHYRDLLRSELFREQPQPQLETTMEQLLRHVQEGPGRPPRPPMAPTKVWARPFQRHLALKRLRSFAALISRVFNHSAR